MDQGYYATSIKVHRLMNEEVLKIWLNLPENTRRSIFLEVSSKTNLPATAIEKDWWVVRTLELIFETEIASYTVFKGGTSLSKAWGMINRFSEDIDLALDRKFLGFDREMTTSQVKKLRKYSCEYISEKFFPLLKEKFNSAGFTDVEFQLAGRTSKDQDPLILEIKYPGVTEKSEYLKPRVLVEIGSRSLIEPFTEKQICSFVGEQFKGRDFADSLVTIPTVNPERTFLEKVFLLHEEFQLPLKKIRVNRLSRHLYDLEKLMDTEFALKAFDKSFYMSIVNHRKTITPLRGIDYANHLPDKINFIPPDDLINSWEKDYEIMQQNMIYGESISFEKLLERMFELKSRINNLKFI